MEMQLPVHFKSAGEFIATKGWFHPTRNLNTFVLIFVKKGTLSIVEDETSYEVKEGSFLILRRNHLHYGKPVVDEELPEYYWAHFTPGIAEIAESKIWIEQCAKPENQDKTKLFFCQLISESRLPDCSSLLCDYLMDCLLITITAITQNPERRESAGALYAHVKEYIKLYYRTDISVEGLAQIYNYSPDYISRCFKKNSGMSIRAYVHHLRLEQAKIELLTTVKTICEIAFDCGYKNEKFFSTTFLKYEGITPSSYRKMYSALHKINRDR